VEIDLRGKNHETHLTYHSCLKKKSFNLHAAETVVQKLFEQGRLMYFYKCALCCSIHLTSKPPMGDSVLRII